MENHGENSFYPICFDIENLLHHCWPEFGRDGAGDVENDCRCYRQRGLVNSLSPETVLISDSIAFSITDLGFNGETASSGGGRAGEGSGAAVPPLLHNSGPHISDFPMQSAPRMVASVVVAHGLLAWRGGYGVWAMKNRASHRGRKDEGGGLAGSAVPPFADEIGHPARNLRQRCEFVAGNDVQSGRT